MKLTADGAVKVLDFGLAKPIEGEAPPGDPETSPTLTLAATQGGVILGTAAYMSPEQARGRPAEQTLMRLELDLGPDADLAAVWGPNAILRKPPLQGPLMRRCAAAGHATRRMQCRTEPSLDPMLPQSQAVLFTAGVAGAIEVTGSIVAQSLRDAKLFVRPPFTEWAPARPGAKRLQ